jgi:hypothetical protein
MVSLIKCFFLSFVFLIVSPCFSKDFKLKLSNYDNEQVMLFVYHEGYSGRVFFKRGFCLSGLGGLKFEISDMNGINYPSESLITDRCKLHDSLELMPSEVYGKLLNDATFESIYGLKKGIYNVKAVVCKYDSDEEKCLQSNSILINIGGSQ